MYGIYRTRTTATMTIQDVVFHKDTLQIHIDKEYHNGSLILEKHYDTMGRCTYSFCIDMSIRYYYPIQEDIQNSIFYALVIHTNSQKLKKVKHNSLVSKEENYDIDKDSCTHLCTLNPNDALDYIKNYIKQYILNSHDL